LGNQWLYTLRAGQAFGWIAFAFALFAFVGTLGQLLGWFSVAGTRSIVLYCSVLTLPAGVIFCACVAPSMTQIRNWYGPTKYGISWGPGLPLAIVGTSLSLLAVLFSCDAGCASGGHGADELKSPAQSSIWKERDDLRPGAPVLSPVSPGGAAVLNLRLQ
jgi:hypothetical protein